MQNLKKTLVLLLALVFIIGAIGCTKTNTDKPNETTKPAQVEDSKGNEEAKNDMLDEFVTITNYNMGNPPASGYDKVVEEKWNEILKDKLNCEMKLMWIEWADWKTKYNLTVASGDSSIDLIHTSSTWLELWENAQKGAFLPLEDLLPTYMPQTWESISEAEWAQCKYDGHIYAVPENNYTQYVNHGLYYRGDWAKELGITEPITTFEEMEVYFQGIIDNKEDVVPWDVSSSGSLLEGYVNNITDYIQTNIATGRHKLIYGKSFEDPYTLVSPVFDDLFVDYAKMMKKWGEAGFWREDVLNFDGDPTESLKAGTGGTDQHHVNTFRTLKVQMEEKQPGSDLQMFKWCDGPTQNLVAEPITHGATSVVSASKNAERALMVLELIRTDEEFYRLFNWGIQGVNWDIDSEGFKVEPEGYDKATQEYYSNFWGGRIDEFELPTREEWSGIYDMWKGLDKIVNKPFPYGNFVIDRTNIDAELTAIGQVTEQYGPAIDFGKVEDPEKTVEDYRAKLKAAGIDKVLEELQKQMDEYAKMMGAK